MEKKLTKDEEYLQKKKASHVGKWLTMEAANEYYKRAQKIGTSQGNVGEIRRLCLELQEEYGVNEIEATNILNGFHISDYVQKYNRILNQIPLIKAKPDKKSKKDEEEEA